MAGKRQLRKIVSKQRNARKTKEKIQFSEGLYLKCLPSADRSIINIFHHPIASKTRAFCISHV